MRGNRLVVQVSQRRAGLRLELCGSRNTVPSGKRLHNYGKSQCLMGKSTISMAIFNSYVRHYQRVMDNITNHKDQQNCDSLQSEDHRRAKLAIPSPNYQTPWIFLIRKKKWGPMRSCPQHPSTMFFFCRGIKGMCFSKWVVCIVSTAG